VSLAPAPHNPDEHVQAFFHALQFQPTLNTSRVTTDNRVRSSVDSTFSVVHAERVSASTGAGLSRPLQASVLKLTPSVSYGVNYVRDTAAPSARHTFQALSTGVSGATTAYGLFYPNRLGVHALRHTIQPSANFGWNPAIAGQQTRSSSVSLRLINTLDAKIAGRNGERTVPGLFEWSLSTNYRPYATSI